MLSGIFFFFFFSQRENRYTGENTGERNRIEKKWEMLGLAALQIYIVNECNVFPVVTGFLLSGCIIGVIPYRKRKGRS